MKNHAARCDSCGSRHIDSLTRFGTAANIGLIPILPAISTHQQQGEEGRKLANIPPNMVRLCGGGEHPDDVIADLDQALNKVEFSTTVAVPQTS